MQIIQFYDLSLKDSGKKMNRFFSEFVECMGPPTAIGFIKNKKNILE